MSKFVPRTDIRHRVFVAICAGAVLFTTGFWICLLTSLATPLLRDGPEHTEKVVVAGVGLVLDALSGYWVFRKLRSFLSPLVARRIAIAFGISAPLFFGLSNVVGGLLGGYTEALLGSRFALGGVIMSNLIVMAFAVPAAVVAWVSPHL